MAVHVSMVKRAVSLVDVIIVGFDLWDNDRKTESIDQIFAWLPVLSSLLMSPLSGLWKGPKYLSRGIRVRSGRLIRDKGLWTEDLLD